MHPLNPFTVLRAVRFTNTILEQKVYPYGRSDKGEILPGTPKEECVGKRLECVVLLFHIILVPLNGIYAKANTV